jgi:hypothetical protein
MTRLNKKYVSDIDQFLVDFDKQSPIRSASQLAEEKKSERITQLMKNPEREAGEPESELWEGF